MRKVSFLAIFILLSNLSVNAQNSSVKGLLQHAYKQQVYSQQLTKVYLAANIINNQEFADVKGKRTKQLEETINFEELKKQCRQLERAFHTEYSELKAKCMNADVQEVLISLDNAWLVQKHLLKKDAPSAHDVEQLVVNNQEINNYAQKVVDLILEEVEYQTTQSKEKWAMINTLHQQNIYIQRVTAVFLSKLWDVRTEDITMTLTKDIISFEKTLHRLIEDTKADKDFNEKMYEILYKWAPLEAASRSKKMQEELTTEDINTPLESSAFLSVYIEGIIKRLTEEADPVTANN